MNGYMILEGFTARHVEQRPLPVERWHLVVDQAWDEATGQETVYHARVASRPEGRKGILPRPSHGSKSHPIKVPDPPGYKPYCRWDWPNSGGDW